MLSPAGDADACAYTWFLSIPYMYNVPAIDFNDDFSPNRPCTIMSIQHVNLACRQCLHVGYEVISQ